MVIKVCQGSTKALRNHLQAQNKRDMVKEEEKKFKVPHGVKNKVFPTVELEWGKHHETQFPLLAKLVKVVFPVTAASSKSEQVFSVAGNVVTPWWSSAT